jgi:hypothetical protein
MIKIIDYEKKYTCASCKILMRISQWIAIIIPVFTAILITVILPSLRKQEKNDYAEMHYNVSAANLQTCSKCGNQYAMTLSECPRCGTLNTNEQR